MGRRDIDKVIELQEPQWEVWIIERPSATNLLRLTEVLRGMGCGGDNIREMVQAVLRREEDVGFTFSSGRDRCSVVVIGESSSAMERANTIEHEQRHVERHICKALHIDPYSEAAAYIAGDLYEQVVNEVCGCGGVELAETGS